MKRWYYWLPLIACIPYAILALFLFPTAKPVLTSRYVSQYFSGEDKPLLDASSGRCTSRNIFLPAPDFMSQLTRDGHFILTNRRDSTTFWIAGLMEGDGSGRFETVPFRAPPWISLIVTGDLTRPGNDLYFLLEGTGKRLPVRARTEEWYWRSVTYALPSDWVGKQIRLAAHAGPRTKENWFGFSNPRALSTGSVFALQLTTVAFLPALVVALGLFLLPGLPAAIIWTRRGRIGSHFLLPLTITFSCLAGYAAFWVYFYNPSFGKWFSGALLLGSAVLFAALTAGSRATRALLRSEQFLTPLALTVLVGTFLLAIVYSVDLEVGPEGQPNLRFFEFTLAVDKDIPFHFAEFLYDGNNVREQFPTRVPGWHSSDRPPLQTGLILLQFPVAHWLGKRWLYSYILGCALQCAWVPAVWALWSAAGLARRQAGLALLFVVLSGFALVNTTFPWPKMLSAGLTLFAVTLGLFERGARGDTWAPGKALLLGLTAALASLGHGGVAFTLLPFGLLLLTPRWYPGWTRLALAGVVYLGMLYPWSLYQRHYDPPGTKLLDQHLAGNYKEPDAERDAATGNGAGAASIGRKLLDAYRALSPQQFLANKLANLKVLFLAAPDQYPWPPRSTPSSWPVGWTGYRRCEFLALFWSLGMLNLGWLVPLVNPWRQHERMNPVLGVTVPALGLAGVAAWVLIMFGPGSTVVHQGSYATFLLLFAYLAARVSGIPGRLPYFLLAAQGLLFLAVWLVTSPANDFGPVNWFMVTWAVILLALLARLALSSPKAVLPPAAK